MDRLKDKVCLVVGAGTGIGRATTLLFAQEGARVVLASKDSSVCAETVKMAGALGKTISYIQADLTDSTKVKYVVDQTLRLYGRIDVLFNNAGHYKPVEIENISENDWDESLAGNLKFAYLMCKEVVPVMKKQKSGTIINTGSLYGPILAMKGQPHYAAGKAGLVGLTQSLAVDLAPFNIRVNCVCPGAVSHQMLTNEGQPISTKKQIVREGLPEDVAFSVLHLASDESAWVTGSVVVVDGGCSVGVSPS